MPTVKFFQLFDWLSHGIIQIWSAVMPLIFLLNVEQFNTEFGPLKCNRGTFFLGGVGQIVEGERGQSFKVLS